MRNVKKASKKKPSLSIVICKRKFSRRAILDQKSIHRLIHEFPNIFKSDFRLVRKKVPSKKPRYIKPVEKSDTALFYRKLISAYSKDEVFTPISSYRTIFRDKGPGLLSWMKFLETLKFRGVIERKVDVNSAQRWVFCTFFALLSVLSFRGKLAMG